MSDRARSPRRTGAGAPSSMCGSRRCSRWSATPSPRRASTRCASGPASSAGRRSRSPSSTRTPGARARARESRLGFKELVAEVGLGQVGIVLALEVSRLARSSADWHQLLDLCALTATLIADADGVYSPQDFNDRLLLGLKGTMSEAELHLIRARLDGGLRNKAERGELRLALPVGLDRDEDDRIVLCPDEQVRHAIERVFALWRRAGLGAPGRDRAGRRGPEAAAPHGRAATHPLGPRQLRRGARLPHQPRLRRRRSSSAKTRQEKRLDGEGRVKVRTVEVPIEEWSVCLPEHHPGYVSWDEYLATRERLRANVRPRGEGGGAAARGRRAAAGHCPLRALRAADAGRLFRHRRQGAALSPASRPRPARDRLHLPVARRRPARQGGRRRVPGGGHPGGVAATAGAIRELDDQHDRASRGPAACAGARASIEADRARRQFDACEPEHRLVARNLERALEDALGAVERERGRLADLGSRPTGAAHRRASARRSRSWPATCRGCGRRDDHHRSRSQGAAARADRRGRRHRRPRGAPRRRRGRSGRAARAPSCSVRLNAPRTRARAGSTRTPSSLIGRLAAHHPDGRSPRSSTARAATTGTGLPFTQARVRGRATARRHPSRAAARPGLSDVVTIEECRATQLESPRRRSAAGWRTDCCPASRSPRTRPGGSA